MTASLESSKRLKELGWEGKREFVYVIMDDGLPSPAQSIEVSESFRYSYCKRVSAPTFEELWAALPEKIQFDEAYGFLDMWKVYYTKEIQQAVICYKNTSQMFSIFKHKSPTEAAALLLIWVLENGHGGKQ